MADNNALNRSREPGGFVRISADWRRQLYLLRPLFTFNARLG